MVKQSGLQEGHIQILPKFVIKANPEMQAREGQEIKITGRPPAYIKIPDAWNQEWQGLDQILTPKQHGPDAEFREVGLGNAAAAAGRNRKTRRRRQTKRNKK